ncbi:eukaryotic translation termination factor 1 [Tieghemostelium lacteum]|uniref:Eukaryotic translation termination factor 1 n=1 Tax=Tieghemostelium lacteum TaxID=361077 RepID=A0A152A518_TIELA|nr:eukaryotic translation termination factor 1 [Tieghemostelium lacteum]|eukprot:KYR01314.1 eukaryotic translation termination factor 1 [Tieghemostelium lacteum]
MSTEIDTEADKQVEQWKIKKLIKNLESVRGNGTSMISLIIRPGDQIAKINKMLTEEYGTASNIKSRVNRLSVLGAITSAQQRLKLYNKVPDNGLIIYCGTVLTDDNKERPYKVDIEPFKPINTSLYLCDNKFHTAPLGELLESDEKFGFIVVDGNGALFGVLCGNTRTVLHRITVDLPKKHGRGGQSALRFARLRMEKRHNYVRKVSELATQFYITNDKPNVSGLVLAGSADFKNELSTSDMFDLRLRDKIVKIVDVSYGGDNGFNQAIELSAEVLSNVKFIQEKKLISTFFEEIAQDTGKYCFGVQDTLRGLENGAVHTLLVWENLEVTRHHLKNVNGEDKILYLNKEQEKNTNNFKDKETGQDYERIESISLVEWFANNYKKFGTTLEIVTNRSQEGSQFCKGFGGLGGLLRYQLDFAALNDYDNQGVEDEEEYDDSDSDF